MPNKQKKITSWINGTDVKLKTQVRDTAGTTYDEAIDINSLSGNSDSKSSADDTSMASSCSGAPPDYVYNDIASVQDSAAHLPGIVLSECPFREVGKSEGLPKTEGPMTDKVDTSRDEQSVMATSDDTPNQFQGGIQFTPIVPVGTLRRPDAKMDSFIYTNQDKVQWRNLADPLLPPVETASPVTGYKETNSLNVTETEESRVLFSPKYVAGRGLTDSTAKLLNEVNRRRQTVLNEDNRLRRGDVHLQAGMADAQDAKLAKHKYARKSKENLKSTRTPSPKFEIDAMEPRLQRPKYPYGTMRCETPSTSSSTRSSDQKVDVPASWRSPADSSFEGTAASMKSHTTAPCKPPPTKMECNVTPKHLAYDTMQGVNSVYETVQRIAILCLEMKQTQDDLDQTQKQIYQQGDGTYRKTELLRQEIRACKHDLTSIKETYLKLSKNIHKLREQANIVQKLKQEVEKMNVSSGNYQDDTKGRLLDLLNMKFEDSYADDDAQRNMGDSFAKDVSFHSLTETDDAPRRFLEQQVMSQYIDTMKDMCDKLDNLILMKGAEPAPLNTNDEKIEGILSAMLDSQKFLDRIKGALAQKLTDWLKQPLLLTNIRKSMHTVFHEEEQKMLIKTLVKEVVDEAQEVWNQACMAQAHSVIDNCHDQMLNLEKFVVQELQGPREQMQLVRNELKEDMKRMAAAHNKHHDETSCEMAILREAVKTNAGKVDICLTNNQKHLTKTVDDLTFKINSGQDEILSHVKEIENAVTDIPPRPEGTAAEIVELKETINNFENVMHSFDKHLTDVKADIELVPVLYETMLEIVRALNTTLGEEVVPEPSINTVEKSTVQPTKQRAARRCKK
jgi:methyl-accepting chemotaxis protein